MANSASGRARSGPGCPRAHAEPRGLELQLRVLRNARGRHRRRHVRAPPPVRRAVPAVPGRRAQRRRLRRRTRRPAVRGGSSQRAQVYLRQAENLRLPTCRGVPLVGFWCVPRTLAQTRVLRVTTESSLSPTALATRPSPTRGIRHQGLILRCGATAPGAIGWRHDGLASSCAHLRELRAGQSAGRQLLQRLRRGARGGGGAARVPQDGHGAVLRRDRVDGARRVDRPGGAARAAGALLRADEGDRRVARRHGGEVHRRRGDGGVRHPAGARGRRAAGLPGGGGDAGRVAGARHSRPDRREHRRGGDGHRRSGWRPGTR